MHVAPEADPYNLQRFVAAQEPVFAAVVEELRTGRKGGHWMWFVFPQVRGLGSSSAAQFYGIGSLDEARAYLAHAVLGPRIRLCTEVVLAIESSSVNAIFGSPDDLKFCSSMKLFAVADGREPSLFQDALDRSCDGVRDKRTLVVLQSQAELP